VNILGDQCKRCASERLLSVNAKCSDMCSINYKDMERHDYVPDYLGIGGGDYVDFEYCLNCGTIQGEFPLEEIDDL